MLVLGDPNLRYPCVKSSVDFACRRVAPHHVTGRCALSESGEMQLELVSKNDKRHACQCSPLYVDHLPPLPAVVLRFHALCYVQPSEPTRVESEWFRFPLTENGAFLVHHVACTPKFSSKGV